MTEPAPVLSDATTRINRIPVAAGGDPLVAEYLSQCRATSAVHVLSPLWVLLGVLFSLAGGVVAHHLWGEPCVMPAFQWTGGWWDDTRVRLLHLYVEHLGDWRVATLGMIGGAGIAAVLARFIHRRGIPATHDPLLALPLVVLVHLYIYDGLIFLAVATGAVCAIYLLVMLFRLLAVLCSLVGGRGLRTAELDEPSGGWPVYTVLVPLYRETAVADKILKHLAALDYPRDRLDVKLLLEADDPATLAAIEAAGVPDWAEVVIVPHAQPKTKPRACNHGLQRAQGEYLVIFDAEDQPEADQLKQAVLAFRRLERSPRGKRIACLQAQLAYRNHAQNLLTRWFTLEYNVWFRAYLPGLVRLGAPIPLGGTSNHFRTEVLRGLHGWDPFNVTEDCDLGIRLHIAGWRTAILDSVTWEEANSRTWNWIRQRSRWMKGYLITHLVWLRRPLWLCWRLNPWGMLCFFSTVFGVAGLAVLNLILWAVMAVFLWRLGIDLSAGMGFGELLITSRDSLQQQFAGPDGLLHQRVSNPMVIYGEGESPGWHGVSVVLFAGSCFLLAANVLFVLINAVFGRRQGQRGLLLPALLSPLYWVLIAIGAWKGLWQLIVKPHYWEKTLHGLDGGKAAAPAAPPQGTG